MDAARFGASEVQCQLAEAPGFQRGSNSNAILLNFVNAAAFFLSVRITADIPSSLTGASAISAGRGKRDDFESLASEPIGNHVRGARHDQFPHAGDTTRTAQIR